MYRGRVYEAMFKLIFIFLQRVIAQGRELAKLASEMSTKHFRDRRPMQTAAEVLMSDLTNLNNRLEKQKQFLQDTVIFYGLIKKVVNVVLGTNIQTHSRIFSMLLK